MRTQLHTLLSLLAIACTREASPALNRTAAPATLSAAPSASAPAAAIIWLPDTTTTSGFHSVWVESDGDRAKVVAERKELVFVGKSELWALASRTVRLSLPACNDPSSQCNAQPELNEPYLKSLATGRSLIPPWKSEFVSTTDVCDKSVDVTIDGAVGTVVFARLSLNMTACGGACPAHQERLAAFDVDTGKAVSIGFPPEIVPTLRAQARKELEPGSPDYCKELPEYRASGEYDKSGELQGLYEFGDDHAGMCSAVGCVNLVERSSRVPVELAQWRKLPSWVAGYLEATSARHALMISAARAAAARREFAR